MTDEIPRRARLDLLTPAERAIWDALQAVEALPADVRLTDAVVLLQAARTRTADYVDGVTGASSLPRWIGTLKPEPPSSKGQIIEGWWRYWGTFGRPWPVVLGFFLAWTVSKLAADIIFAIIEVAWEALR